MFNPIFKSCLINTLCKFKRNLRRRFSDVILTIVLIDIFGHGKNVAYYNKNKHIEQTILKYTLFQNSMQQHRLF